MKPSALANLASVLVLALSSGGAQAVTIKNYITSNNCGAGQFFECTDVAEGFCCVDRARTHYSSRFNGLPLLAFGNVHRSFSQCGTVVNTGFGLDVCVAGPTFQRISGATWQQMRALNGLGTIANYKPPGLKARDDNGTDADAAFEKEMQAAADEAKWRPKDKRSTTNPDGSCIVHPPDSMVLSDGHKFSLRSEMVPEEHRERLMDHLEANSALEDIEPELREYEIDHENLEVRRREIAGEV
ncbi:hypothetical protein B0H66DRAFT_532426 [Apodospora peruviana]|uniref:Uncharacterized protein n=1 Tax=Apodospora peruviana TaxID=516989 RepID=A0AAE0I3I8_9PEZI|nr:hypothetical protein B0H66DRAFT_532426 [Apodospora peruviana]